MTVIEQDGIRVEAETQELALKMLKKEQRKQRAEANRIAAIQAQAEIVAKSRGFDVMSRILDNTQRVPRGWGINRSAPSVKSESVRYGVYNLTASDWNPDTKDFCRSSREVYCYGIDALLENGAGQPMIIWLIQTIGEDSEPYAIAGLDGCFGLVPMPKSIRPEMFAKQES